MTTEELIASMKEAGESEENITLVKEELGVEGKENDVATQSATAASNTVALENTVSTSEDGSLVSPNKQQKLVKEKEKKKDEYDEYGDKIIKIDDPFFFHKPGDIFDYNFKSLEEDGLYTSHWLAKQKNEDGTDSEIIVSTKDVPRKYIKLWEKNVETNIDKDINSVHPSELFEYINPSAYESEDESGKIRERVLAYLKLRDNQPKLSDFSKPRDVGRSRMVMGEDGEMIEIQEAQNIELTSDDAYYEYQHGEFKRALAEYNRRTGYTKFGDGIALEEASSQLRLEGINNPTRKQVMDKLVENEMIDWRTKQIEKRLTKLFESNLTWGDTGYSLLEVMVKSFTGHQALGHLVDDTFNQLGEGTKEQNEFLNRLHQYYKDIGIKYDVTTGAPIYSEAMLNASAKLEFMIDKDGKNGTLIKSAEKLDNIGKEYKIKNTYYTKGFAAANSEIDKLSHVDGITTQLNELQDQLDAYSTVAIEGVLSQEDYTNYEKIHDQYTELYNDNIDDITNYQIAVSNYNTLYEEYNTTGKFEIDQLSKDYATHRENHLAQQNVYKGYYEELTNLLEDDRDLAAYIDLAGRDYRNVIQWTQYMKTSLVNMGVGVANMAWAVYPPTLIDHALREYYSQEEIDGGDIPDIVKAMFSVYGDMQMGKDDMQKAIDNVTAKWMSSVQKRQKWDETVDDFDWGEYILGASADFAPQLALMIVAPQASLYLLAASSGGSKYNELTEANKHGGDYSMWDIYAATAITTGSEYFSEKVTLGLVKKSGGMLSGMRREGWNKGWKNMFNPKTIGYGIYETGGEILSEMGAKFGENFGDIVAGKNISIFDGINEAGFNGLIMAGHIKAPVVFRSMVNPFLPKEESVILEENAKKMMEIDKQLADESLTDEAKGILKEQLQTVLAENANIIKDVVDRTNDMSTEELRAVMDADIQRVETQNLIQEILKDKSIPLESKKQLIEDAKNKLYEIDKRRHDVLTEVKLRQDTEVAKKGAEKLGIENFETIETVEDFQTTYEEVTGKKDNRRNSDAFVFTDTDGKTHAYINKVRAKQIGAISAGSHELLHAIVNTVFNGEKRTVKNKQGEDVDVTLTEEGKKLVDSFISSLSASERAIVQKRIDNNYRFHRDKNGKILKDDKGNNLERAKEEYYEEYMNSYSDAIRKGQINPSNGTWAKIGRKLGDYYHGKGYENLTFAKGRDVKNFLHDYTKDIKSGDIRQSILDVAGPDGAKIGEVKFSKSEISDSDVDSDIQLIRRRKSQVNRASRESGQIIKDPKTIRAENSVIDAIKNPVEALTEHLTKKLYDPIAREAREDAGIDRNLYKESLRSELNTMVIEEWDINQQDVERFIINRGYLRAQSLAKRLGIQSVEAQGGPGIMKRGEDLDQMVQESDEISIDFDAWRTEVYRQLDADEISTERAEDLLEQIDELEQDKPKQEFETGKVRKILGIEKDSDLYNKVLEEVRVILKDINFDNSLADLKTQKAFRQILSKGFVEVFGEDVRNIIGTQKSETLKEFLTKKFANEKGKIIRLNKTEIIKLIGVKYANRFRAPNSLVTNKGILNVDASVKTQTSIDGSFVMNEKAGNETWVPNTEMSDARFLEIITQGRETQYKALIEALSNELGLDAVFEVLPESAVKHKNKLTEAIKRNPSVMLSETSIEDHFPTPQEQSHLLNTNTDVIIKEGQLVLRLAITHGYKTPEFNKAIEKEGISTATMSYLDANNFGDYFNANVSGFKEPLFLAMNKGELGEEVQEMLDAYFADVMNKTNQTSKDQLAESMSTLIDKLPPQVVAMVPAAMFGLIGSNRILHGGKGKKYQSLQNQYKKKKAEKPWSEKKMKKLGVEIDFDPSKTEILNAGYGLMNNIQNILAQPEASWEIKRDKVREKYGDRIDNANHHNPRALKYLVKVAASMVAESPINNVGIIRWFEAATNNVLGQRGLTTIDLIQYHAESQAPYVARDKAGEIVKYFGKKPGAKEAKKYFVVEVNNEHPDYRVAERVARARAEKSAIKNKKDAAWVEQEIQNIIGQHLRFKGEHINPSSNVMREITKLILKIASNQNIDFNTEYAAITANFSQSLGVEAYSKLQDNILGSTSELGDMRILAIENESNVNINSFRTSDAAAIQVTGYVQRKFLDGQNIESLKNTVKSLNTPTAQQVSNERKISGAIKESRTTSEVRGISIWDFDDTLANTKSGVRYTLPNLSGIPQPGRKVIFLAGGAGSGKGNVISKLGLEKQGFKIVNSDISLEWLKKNSGLPENMNDFTKEQRSTLSKLQHQARGIAKRKMMKFQGNADGVVIDGTGGSLNVMKKQVQEFKDKGYDVQMIFVETSLETALERNKARKERSLLDKIVEKNHEAVQNNKKGFKELFGNNFAEVKTDNLKQDSPMPKILSRKVDRFTKGYIKGRLDAGEFADKGGELLSQGAEFDFAEFDVIVEGEQGPLFGKAMARAKKYGTKDQFILTARTAVAAPHIQQFLKSQGLDIALENIVGLGNSTAEAKALWIAGKVGEGYNDIYFADDALQNVEAVDNMLEQFDVKRKVQQAKRQRVGIKKKKSKKESIKSELGDVNNLGSPDNYNNIKFSESHRSEYENTISKYRPDLVKDGLVSKTIDDMFIFIDNLNIPNNKKRKYERITTKWLATSNIKIIEDRFKITDAINLAERFNLDLFSYNNPNEIIEAYAGKVKAKPLNPNKAKNISPGRVLNEKHGLMVYEVEDTKEGMQDVRNIINSHWGENSNPWCLTQARNGKLTDDAWINWTVYDKSKKYIVLQNGRLSSFYANNQYWDRMDSATDAPVIHIKEGRVTKKVELVPAGRGEVQEFVMETRTVSEDGNTVTTEILAETIDGYSVGTKIVENRVNGITVKSTRYGKNGNVSEIINFDKSGKAINNITFEPGGKTTAINRYGTPFGDMSVNDIVMTKGDLLSHEVTDGDMDYYHGQISLDAQGIKSVSGVTTTEIGWKMPKNLDLQDFVTTSPSGEIRVDFKKILEVDPDAKGIPSEKGYTPVTLMFSETMDNEFNQILEDVTGLGAHKEFSGVKAELRGKNKGNWKFFIPPSAEDFKGLLYAFLGKGKQGEKHLEFFTEILLKPFARGYRELNAAKQTMANDIKTLRSKMPRVRKLLNKKIEGQKDFTYDNAVRVYLWDKAGFEVPGLSNADKTNLVEVVKSNAELMAFADVLGLITKQVDGYVTPSPYWLTGNTQSDVADATGKVGREQYFSEWIENKNIIFSEKNLNKIEALYGLNFREALEDMLWRMEKGTNRTVGQNKLVNKFQNWLNNSVGAIMFFNMRSAVLQTLSIVNFINWGDNNMIKAAAAFANQPQFWKDFAFLFNSDMLKQRRTGLKTDINSAELTQAVGRSKNPVAAALNWFLQKGFLPTQIADSFAIASGGAAFYRNRVKTYLKEGLSQKEAETKAFEDFQEVAEETQQSSRPDLISQQQASTLGRIILAFQNTPMQYMRLTKKAVSDLVNGRGDAKSNISKIIYYGFVQNLIFYSLQQALFALAFDEPEDEEVSIDVEKKKLRLLNGMLDSILRGTGVYGAVVSTIKNVIIKLGEEEKKTWNREATGPLIEALNISPPLGSKARKLWSAYRSWDYNRDVIKDMERLDIDNPIWDVVGNVVSATTNIPLDRVINKTKNVREALNEDNETWQRIALMLGWNRWDLNVKSDKIELVKTNVKEKKKIISKEKAEEKKKVKEAEKQLEIDNQVKEEKKLEKKGELKDPKCSNVSSKGKRCNISVSNAGDKCTIHEEVEQVAREIQCKFMKPINKKKKERCGMMTKSKSGLCYYHD